MEFHVAPMKDITNWTFRRKCSGATDSYTEMIQLRDILANKVRPMQKLDLRPIEGQHQWIQILTNSPRDMEKLPSCLSSFSKNYPERSHIFGININVGRGIEWTRHRGRQQDGVWTDQTSFPRP